MQITSGACSGPARALAGPEDFAAGRIPAEELRGVEDDAIRDIVLKQEDVGLRSVTDGEFRRASWHTDFMYGLDGIEKAPSNMKVEFHNAGGDIEFTPAALKVEGRIGLKQAIFGEAFEYLKSLTTNAATPKLTIPSPSMVHYRGDAPR